MAGRAEWWKEWNGTDGWEVQLSVLWLGKHTGAGSPRFHGLDLVERQIKQNEASCLPCLGLSDSETFFRLELHKYADIV